MTEADRIAELEQLLVDQWGVFVEAFIVSADQAKRSAAFLAVDRRLRKLGLLPSLERTP